MWNVKLSKVIERLSLDGNCFGVCKYIEQVEIKELLLCF